MTDVLEHTTFNKEKISEQEDWLKEFHDLSKGGQMELLTTICNNWSKKELHRAISNTKDGKLKNILEYYLPDDSNETGLFLNNDIR